jgi:hypothetical protein
MFWPSCWLEASVNAFMKNFNERLNNSSSNPQADAHFFPMYVTGDAPAAGVSPPARPSHQPAPRQR